MQQQRERRRERIQPPAEARKGDRCEKRRGWKACREFPDFNKSCKGRPHRGGRQQGPSKIDVVPIEEW